MKKGILLCAFVLVGVLASAQETGNPGKVQVLIQGGLNSNFDAIQAESALISDVDRLRLYNANVKKPWAGAALNFFLGYGIGNFVQGDYLGGGIALGGELVGLGLIVAGYIRAMNTLGDLTGTVYEDVGTGSYPYSDDAVVKEFFTFFLIGAGTMAVSSLFGFIRTFAFPSSYNKKLANALSGGGLTLNIEPNLDIGSRGASLALVRLSF
jgi:hypothetical protein